jgi:hypothetical protein
MNYLFPPCILHLIFLYLITHLMRHKAEEPSPIQLSLKLLYMMLCTYIRYSTRCFRLVQAFHRHFHACTNSGRQVNPSLRISLHINTNPRPVSEEREIFSFLLCCITFMSLPLFFFHFASVILICSSPFYSSLSFTWNRFIHLCSSF